MKSLLLALAPLAQARSDEPTPRVAAEVDELDERLAQGTRGAHRAAAPVERSRSRTGAWSPHAALLVLAVGPWAA